MSVEDVFTGVLGGVAGALLTMLLTQMAAIANARRTSYVAVAARLVELWRAGGCANREPILTELTKLAMDGNKDLYDEIEAFGEAVTAGDDDAGVRLRLLLDRMLATSALAQVRESLIGRGRSRTGLFKKLIEH